MLKRFGDRKTVLIGFITFLLAYTWLTFLNNLWEYMVVLVLVGFGAACTLNVLNGMMSKSVGKERQGEMMGLSTAADNLSQILGPTIGTFLISLPNTYLYGLSTVVFSLVALLLSFIPLQNISGISE